jgi:hypothetical protein
MGSTPRVLAVVPVGLLRRRGRLLDKLRGRRLDHHERRAPPPAWAAPPARGSPPAWAAPPATATPDDDPRAPGPPAVPPRGSAVPPAAYPPDAAPVEPASCRPGASAPATGTSRRNLGGDGRANQKQPYQHKRPHDLFHVEALTREPVGFWPSTNRPGYAPHTVFDSLHPLGGLTRHMSRYSHPFLTVEAVTPLARSKLDTQHPIWFNRGADDPTGFIYSVIRPGGRERFIYPRRAALPPTQRARRPDRSGAPTGASDCDNRWQNGPD